MACCLAWSSVNFHKHGSRNVAVVPRVIRVWPRLRPELVDDGVAWLEDHWQGDVFIPDELLPLVAVA